MKDFAKFLLTLAIAGVSVMKLDAQSTEPFNPYSALSPSVESWQMTKSGNLSPSLYTGAMMYSVPLYTYSDPDFNLPVSLSYSFDGYRPSSDSGTIGYGWALDCGGVITREVRGLPDEDAVNGAGSRSLYGYWFSTRETNDQGVPYSTASNGFGTHERWATYSSTMGAGPFINRQIALSVNPYSSVPTQVWIGTTQLPDYTSDMYPFYTTVGLVGYDMTPDIFHFSYLGHSGDFMLMPDGSVKVFNSDIPHGELSVEFDMSNAAAHDSSEPHTSGFVISDGNGFRYYFGSSFPALEFGASYNTVSSTLNFPILFSTTAWHLTRIEAPNGRSIEFNYSSDKQMTRRGAVYHSPEKHNDEGVNIPSRAGHQYSYGWSSVLESISVCGQPLITMSYNDKACDESSSQYFDSYPVNPNIAHNSFRTSTRALRLESIRVDNIDSDAVEQIQLSQCYAESGTPKMFLRSVNTRKGGTHLFDYNLHAITLPLNDTKSTDHWGYWNDRYYSDIIRITRFSGSRYEQMTGPGKDPVTRFALAGALTSITYPTGGSTTIEYEGNVAASGLDEEGTVYYPSAGSMDVGGVRVCALTDREDASDAGRTTTYGYEGGFLFHMPRYVMTVLTDLRYQDARVYEGDGPILDIDTETIGFYTTAYGTDCDYGVSRDCAIGYSTVRATHPDGSVTINEFSNYDGGTADVYAIGAADGSTGESPYFVFTKRGLFSHMDNFDIGAEGSYGPYIAMPTSDRKNLRGKPTRVREYDDAGTLVRQTVNSYIADVVSLAQIYYNNLDSFITMPWECLSPMLSNVQVTDYTSDGSAISSSRSTSYNPQGQKSCETVTSTNSPEEQLSTSWSYCHEYASAGMQAYLPAAVQSVERSRTTQAGTYLTDRTVYHYQDPLVHTGPASITRHGYSDGTLSDSEVTSILYDSDSLWPVWVFLPGGSDLSYDWDGTHLVTRNQNGLATDYTWKDLVGLTSMIKPNGSRESYSYDINNRLKGIADSQGRTLLEYRYNLKNHDILY